MGIISSSESGAYDGEVLQSDTDSSRAIPNAAIRVASGTTEPLTSYGSDNALAGTRHNKQ